MPDTGWPRVCVGAAIFRPGPAAGTIKVYPSFHNTITEIKHAVNGIPRAHRVSGKCAKVAIYRAKSCCGHGSQCHLMTGVGNSSFMGGGVSRAVDYAAFFHVEPVIVGD